MLYVCFRVVFHPVLYRTIMKTCVTHTVMKNIATMFLCIWAYVSQKKLINIPVGYERLTYQNIWENFRNSYNTVMKKKNKKKTATFILFTFGFYKLLWAYVTQKTDKHSFLQVMNVTKTYKKICITLTVL